jgi:hypothetical protein
MREYFYHLYREYILPSRISVDSAVLSFPSILNLKTHRMLLDVLEEILGLAEVSIIPQPLALVHGYNIQTPPVPLTGDIMVIQNDDAAFNFAFINLVGNNNLTLEKQCTGSFPLAAGEAELIGLYSPTGWKINTVLLTGEPPYPSDLEELIKSLPEEVTIISEPNLEFTAINGLCQESMDNGSKLYCAYNLIYPYEFFIEKNTGIASSELVKIPFDTVNFELKCGASYQLLTLDSSGIYNLAAEPSRINLRIYESGISTGFCSLEPSAQPNLILEIDSFKYDLPQRLRLFLDMANASLGLDFTPNKPDKISHTPLDFHTHLQDAKDKLYKTMKANNGQPMAEDFDNQSISACRETQDTLTNQIELTLFRLRSILHLWEA